MERGPLEVWVNNAGVLRTRKAWEHSDEEVRLLAEVNVMGVIWGSRAAIDAMRDRGGQNMHVINLASLSAPGAGAGPGRVRGDQARGAGLHRVAGRGPAGGGSADHACTPSAPTARTPT